MITEKQIIELARYFHIDNFTIIREYLQLLFLTYLYQERGADKLYFKGGTAIRFLLDSPRFSEDLDFSASFKKGEIKNILAEIEILIQKELPGLKIVPLYLGRKTSRFRLKFQPSGFKYPLSLRLDFNHQKPRQKTVVSPLVTKFPIVIFPLISHLSVTEILAEKLCALATRGKGRDFFDVWFLLEKGIKIDKKLVIKKLKEAGRKFDKNALIEKIKTYPQARLNRDLAQFLPLSQREVTAILKERVVQEINL